MKSLVLYTHGRGVGGGRGVINLNLRIEEWIDDQVAVILYERFFNWEIMAGNYLVKNSKFGLNFLDEWANFEFHLPHSYHGNDQGPLMMLLLKLLIPGSSVEYHACERYWKNATDLNTYLAMVYCVRQALGAAKIWHDKVRIFCKYHAFARDDDADGHWCAADFMFHGWKKVERNQIFEEDIDLNLCYRGLKAWKWKNKNISVQELGSPQYICSSKRTGRAATNTCREDSTFLARPVNVTARPVIVAAQPAAFFSQSARPVTVNARPVFVDARPVIVAARAAAFFSQSARPVAVDARPAIVDA